MKGHHVLAAIYLTKQSEKNKSTTLKLPPGGEEVSKRILLDDVFWERVVSSLKLLKPIAVSIARIEGDNDILSDV